MEHGLTLAAIVAAINAYTGPQVNDASGGVSLEAWQVINLVGAPLLALLFMAPVIDDLKAWLVSVRNNGPGLRR